MFRYCHCGHLEEEHAGGFFRACTCEGCDCDDFEHDEDRDDDDDEEE